MGSANSKSDSDPPSPREFHDVDTSVSNQFQDDGVPPSSTSPPSLISLDDLIRIESWNPQTNTNDTTFLLITDDDEVFFGRASTNPANLTLDECRNLLQRVPDSHIFPEIPRQTSVTMAPANLAGPIYCKRPGLFQFEPGTDTGTPRLVLEETIIMETLAKNPHPHIIRYYGCRSRRGRITGIVLQAFQDTLMQFVLSPAFENIDQEKFMAAITSAVNHLHSLGLAHNDINPGNILVDANGMPVLIDFGSCQPFGKHLLTFGTPGWYEETFWTSEAKHDIFGLQKLREWMQQMRFKHRHSVSAQHIGSVEIGLCKESVGECSVRGYH